MGWFQCVCALLHSNCSRSRLWANCFFPTLSLPPFPPSLPSPSLSPSSILLFKVLGIVVATWLTSQKHPVCEAYYLIIYMYMYVHPLYLLYISLILSPSSLSPYTLLLPNLFIQLSYTHTHTHAHILSLSLPLWFQSRHVSQFTHMSTRDSYIKCNGMPHLISTS